MRLVLCFTACSLVLRSLNTRTKCVNFIFWKFEVYSEESWPFKKMLEWFFGIWKFRFWKTIKKFDWVVLLLITATCLFRRLSPVMHGRHVVEFVDFRDGDDSLYCKEGNTLSWVNLCIWAVTFGWCSLICRRGISQNSFMVDMMTSWEGCIHFQMFAAFDATVIITFEF